MLQTAFWTLTVPPQTHYRIDCRADPQDGTLVGSETIQVRNSSPRPLKRLAVEWPGNGSRPVQLTVQGRPVLPLTVPVTHSTEPLLFDLPEAIDCGEAVEIQLEFAQPLNASGDADGLVVTDWHPRLWCGFPTHASYDASIDAPDGWAVGASGRRDSDSRRYSATAARAFGFFLGRTHIVETAQAGDVEIRCLFTERGRECAQLLLETTVDAVGYYRERFGMYPYSSLTIIPGASQPMGGYPVATGLVVVHGQECFSERPDLHWRWITAHEIGHQYWGEYVLEREPSAWLSIGLGIFADREYALARDLGPTTHERLMVRYTQGVRQHLDTTVAIPPEQLGEVAFDYNNVVTHGKGFSIVSALACLLGKETFDRVYLRALSEFAGLRLGTGAFQSLCEEESQQDLDWFFHQWLQTRRYVSYEIASQTSVPVEGGYQTDIRIDCLGTLRMPMPVLGVFTDGTRQTSFTDRLSGTSTVRFQSTTPLAQAVLDPEHEIAQVVPPPAPTEPELDRKLRELPWTGAGEAALALFQEASGVTPVRGEFWGPLGLRLYDGRNYAEALEAFETAAEVPDPSSSWRFAALVWQGHILDLTGRREEASRLLQRSA